MFCRKLINLKEIKLWDKIMVHRRRSHWNYKNVILGALAQKNLNKEIFNLQI